MAIGTPVNYAKEYSSALAQKFPYVLNFGALYNTPNLCSVGCGKKF